jgi:hypothetical protein
MEMPAVDECAVDACAYNRDRTCHALAITVGNGNNAHCGTFFMTSVKGGDPSAIGRVGACKLSDCEYNVELECQAPGIAVGYQQQAVDCLTYQPR